MVAEVVKALVPAPWQRDVMPEGAEGVLAVGVTCTVVAVDVAVPQPFATTVMLASPLKLGLQVTVPVVDVPLMLLPVPVIYQV